jgi:hypothetical protein
MQPLRMRDSKRTRTQMLAEQASQVAAGDAEPVRQFFDVAIFQRSVRYQAKSTLNCRRRTFPGWRTRSALRSTPEAGTIPGLTSGRRRPVKRNVLAFGRICRTNRPAIYSGRLNTNKEATVEPGIAREPRLFEDFVSKSV